ncbi:MAG TPA: hypothetical protein VFL59_08705 [Candidatus Nanopelagicales bacterium]|nr:hypothetical protein [Candidatus Nanopelagicales bacterium]
MRLRPPAEVRARAQGERVLAWLPAVGSSLVATDRALVLPAGVEPQRVPWDRVLHASWDPGSLRLTAQDPAGGRPTELRIPVPEDHGSLPEVVRERVKASIVVQHHVELHGEQGARLVARRTPGDTVLRWSVVFDPGLDPTDPALRARADEELARLRGSLGV